MCITFIIKEFSFRKRSTSALARNERANLKNGKYGSNIQSIIISKRVINRAIDSKAKNLLR